MKSTYQILSAFIFSMWFTLSNAQTIELQAPGASVIGQALYTSVPSDNANKPVVLILHGFSATHNYPTVATLQDFLNIEGYSTLSPTLTMNIPMRSQPLSCNSLHTHTLEQDIAELMAWISWLEQQGHKEIVLIGHSSGSQTILEALAANPVPSSIKGLIFTSLFYLAGQELGNKTSDRLRAEQLIREGIIRPEHYSFLFCQDDYFATAESYLSYLKITRERVIQTLKQLDRPNHTLMAGNDTRYGQVGKKWLDELQETGTKLTIIEGANHFFTGEQEPAFQDNLLRILQTMEAAR
ncbi:alpha/beta hydrolase [Thiomicrospira microaerophila]|uniref:alpha/beta hydrolase n=1 Tax=Thiomicrospira microaerophila TaxID=406020 RepID=UPI0012FDFAFF|nr:alpha/beta fold hydrolase [Thiomicrospira microaerophila]